MDKKSLVVAIVLLAVVSLIMTFSGVVECAYDADQPANDVIIASWPALTRENMRALKDDQLVNARAISAPGWLSEGIGRDWAEVADSPSGGMSVAHCGGGLILVGTDDGSIWRRAGWGQGWSLATTTDQDAIESMAYCGGGVAVAGAWNATATQITIYRTTDYGATWGVATDAAGLGNRITALEYCGASIVLAGTYSGGEILRSADRGETWAIATDTPYSYIHAIRSCGSGTVLAGAGGGVGQGVILRSTDYGANWGVATTTPEEYVRSLCSCGGGVALAGTGLSLSGNAHVYKSSDSGSTWSYVASLATFGAGVEALEYCGDGVILANVGAIGGYVVKSLDSGDTWASATEAFAAYSALEHCGNGVVVSLRANGVIESAPMAPGGSNNAWFLRGIPAIAFEDDQNVIIGVASLGCADPGDWNVGLGPNIMASATDASYNVAIGPRAMQHLTEGNQNTAIGMGAGMYRGLGFSTTPHTHFGASTYVGYFACSMEASATVDNEIVIGANAVGAGSNTVTLGNDRIEHTYLKGIVHGTFEGGGGGTSTVEIGPLSAAAFYDSTAGQTIYTSETAVNMTETRYNNATSVFELSSNAVTVATTGVYLVSWSVGHSLTTGTRSGFRSWLKKYSGSWADVPGTRAISYMRVIGEDMGSSAGTTVVDLTGGEKIAIAALGTTQEGVTASNSVYLSIVHLTGAKGDKGDTGAAGSIEGLTWPIPIASGGTNATTAGDARDALDVYSTGEVDALVAGGGSGGSSELPFPDAFYEDIGGRWSYLTGKDNAVYAGCYCGGGVVFLGTYESSNEDALLYRNDNYGSGSWTVVDPFSGYTDYGMSSVVFCGQNTILAATKSEAFLSKSTNLGSSWTSVSVSNGVNAMAYCGNGIVVGVGYSPFSVSRSTDSGSTWSVASTTASCVAVAYCGSGTVIVGGPVKIIRSVDSGATWALASSTPADVLSLAYCGSSVVLAGGNGGQVYRSTDRGATWATAQTGVGTQVNALGYLGHGVALAATGDDIYRSGDYGVTWAIATDTTSTQLYTVVPTGNGGAIVGGDGNGAIFGSMPAGSRKW